MVKSASHLGGTICNLASHLGEAGYNLDTATAVARFAYCAKSLHIYVCFRVYESKHFQIITARSTLRSNHCF